MLSVADIPFERRAPLPLLGLEGESPPGDDFDAYGWCRPDAVWLDDGARRRVEAPLLLALHTPDAPQQGPLMLEFWLHHQGEAIAVQVPWARFAAEHVVPLLGPERDVVLALCNPLRQRVVLSSHFADRRVHVAEGDVRAYLDPDLRLTADRWRIDRAARV